MTTLSPAAQAVMDAIDKCFAASTAPPTSSDFASAVLRAAVEQTIKPDPLMGISSIIYARDLLAIATELEQS